MGKISVTRRRLIRQGAQSIFAAGVLGPLWDAVADTGDITRAYTEELLSIEAYTKGKIRVGDEITVENVEYVKDLLEPIKYAQIVQLGRRLKVAATTTDLQRLSPWEYNEATLRNRGLARFDSRGNVVTVAGQPWTGGNPFPQPTSAVELFAGLTLSWGRHDASLYCIKEYDLSSAGDVLFEYESTWAELAPIGRVSVQPKPYWPGHEDTLRFQSVFFCAPEAVRGASFLNVWAYDQTTFPVLYGYLPLFDVFASSPANSASSRSCRDPPCSCRMPGQPGTLY